MSTLYKSPEEVPSVELVARLRELGSTVTKGPEAVRREFNMRIPAEVDHDADLVLYEAAKRIERLAMELAKAQDERDGHFRALAALSRGLGSPAVDWTNHETIEAALVVLVLERLADAIARAEKAEGERDHTLPAKYKCAVDEVVKLREFKAYVHTRLDEMAIPTDPKGEHSAQGCRVGERLDIVAAAVEIVREFAAEPCAYGDGCPTFGTRHGRCIQCKAKVALRIGPDDCADCHGDRVHGCAPFCTGMKFPVPPIDGGTTTLPVEGKAETICRVCKDTHTMHSEADGRSYMCTHCPAPCPECRTDGRGPYCENTPCACGCHKGDHRYLRLAKGAQVTP